MIEHLIIPNQHRLNAVEIVLTIVNQEVNPK